ncbi:MAG: tetratricopeptide repeat protein [Candidatus Heimdallarchaeota archaeon]|nr:tetratricopeptide repeat protein [Candidatus Heimdallarchaeota archaeon]
MKIISDIDEIYTLVDQKLFDQALYKVSTLNVQNPEAFWMGKLLKTEINHYKIGYAKSIKAFEEIIKNVTDANLSAQTKENIKLSAKITITEILYKTGNLKEGLLQIDKIINEFDIEKSFQDIFDEDKNLIGKNYYFIKYLAQFFYWKGIYEQAQTNYGPFLKFVLRSQKLNKLINDQFKIARDHYTLGLGYHSHMGEHVTALMHINKSLKLHEILDNHLGRVSCYRELGQIYSYIGDLELSLRFRERSLQLAEEINDKRFISICLGDMGIINYKIGQEDMALHYFEKLLEFLQNNQNAYTNGDSYLYLTLIRAERVLGDDASEMIDDILEKMKSILVNRLDSSIGAYQKNYLNYIFKLTRAIELKNQKRTMFRYEAQTILEELIAENIIDIELNQLAILNLTEILLDEFAYFGEQDIFEEAEQLIQHQYLTALDKNASPQIIDSLILKSRLSLINGDIELSKKMLDEADDLAIRNELFKLQDTVMIQKKLLNQEINKWKGLLHKSTTIKDRVEISRFKEYILQAQKLKRSQQFMD